MTAEGVARASSRGMMRARCACVLTSDGRDVPGGGCSPRSAGINNTPSRRPCSTRGGIIHQVPKSSIFFVFSLLRCVCVCECCFCFDRGLDHFKVTVSRTPQDGVATLLKVKLPFAALWVTTSSCFYLLAVYVIDGVFWGYAFE